MRKWSQNRDLQKREEMTSQGTGKKMISCKVKSMCKDPVVGRGMACERGQRTGPNWTWLMQEKEPDDSQSGNESRRGHLVPTGSGMSTALTHPASQLHRACRWGWPWSPALKSSTGITCWTTVSPAKPSAAIRFHAPVQHSAVSSAAWALGAGPPCLPHGVPEEGVVEGDVQWGNPLPLHLSALASLVSLQFLEYAVSLPVSGPLHRLCPLCGAHFPFLLPSAPSYPTFRSQPKCLLWLPVKIRPFFTILCSNFLWNFFLYKISNRDSI